MFVFLLFVSLFWFFLHSFSTALALGTRTRISQCPFFCSSLCILSACWLFKKKIILSRSQFRFRCFARFLFGICCCLDFCFSNQKFDSIFKFIHCLDQIEKKKKNYTSKQKGKQKTTHVLLLLRLCFFFSLSLRSFVFERNHRCMQYLSAVKGQHNF